MMKNVKLKLAILGAFGVLSAQALATGLVPLPSTGFVVAAGANQPAGTTAYTRCNTTGNYGSSAATAPTAGANNTCAVFPANVNTTPVAGFSSIAAGTATTPLTGNGGEALATMHQRLFRNAANTSCIYGKYFVMNAPSTFDYNASRAGTNALEVNDYVLGGFDNTATVNAGYYYHSTAKSPVFRIGRAYTSVQTHANGVNMGTGYVHRPINAPSPGTIEINGVGQVLVPPGPVPTAAQQTADIRTNWVDFTTDVTGGPDEDNGLIDATSSMLYVQADCTNAAPVSLANSVILRQTGQETQPWITIKKAGFARSGANATP
jgi:hypothetical protein